MAISVPFSDEAGVDSGSTELTWGMALARSFPCRPLLGGCTSGHGHGHGHEHAFSVLLEGRGVHPLGSSDEDDAYEALLGVVVPLTSRIDLRAAWTFLWEGDEDAEQGFVLGAAFSL